MTPKTFRQGDKVRCVNTRDMDYARKLRHLPTQTEYIGVVQGTVHPINAGPASAVLFDDGVIETIMNDGLVPAGHPELPRRDNRALVSAIRQAGELVLTAEELLNAVDLTDQADRSLDKVEIDHGAGWARLEDVDRFDSATIVVASGNEDRALGLEATVSLRLSW